MYEYVYMRNCNEAHLKHATAPLKTKISDIYPFIPMGYELMNKLLFLKGIQCSNTRNDVIFSGYRGRKQIGLTY